eukprot:TRINITY_DN23335_c0_g1_i1.p1 TRINITY_DN23335_c0_g1~~TRINITY_DN23335_c0_g1_i1.p1  ORF type:complete len:235 (-),score=74.00 TRINITY_DN23335_c0_g1_i1:139-843(-)
MLQKILAANRLALGEAYLGDKSAPDIVVRFVPGLGGPHGFFDLEEGSAEHERVWGAIAKAVTEDIAPHADFYCLCCNTLHFLEPKLRALPTEASCPLVSIVEATAQYCEQHGVKSACVLGSQLITDVHTKQGGSPYAALTCELDVLSEEHRAAVQDGLKEIKQHGPGDERVVRRFQGMCGELCCEALVLACTELPLLDWEVLYQGREVPRLIDPTQVLADELVRQSLLQEPVPQ